LTFTLFQQAEKERQHLFPQLIWYKLLFSPGSQDGMWEAVNTVSTMLKMNADFEYDNLAESCLSCCLPVLTSTYRAQVKRK